MNYTDRLIELARCKERLVARAERERRAVADELRRWRKPIGVLDRGVAVVRFLKAHPALAFGAAATAAVVGRRNPLRWLGRGWVVWRTWRALETWTRKFAA